MQLLGYLRWKLHKWRTGHMTYWPIRLRANDKLVCRRCNDCGADFR